MVRSLDEKDQICYGHNYREGIVDLLEGGLFEKLNDTGRQVRAKKLLAPLEPKALLCIGLSYRQHVEETGFKIPPYPALFMKNPGTLAHPDEISDPQNLQQKCLLNGNTMQDDHPSDTIFSVAELIRYLSTDMTLLPGTVILTGTPQRRRLYAHSTGLPETGRQTGVRNRRHRNPAKSDRGTPKISCTDFFGDRTSGDENHRLRPSQGYELKHVF